MKFKLVFSILFLVGTASTLSAQKKIFSITVLNLNEQEKYKQMVTDAMALLIEVINSDNFEQRVVNHQYDWVNLGGTTYNNLSGRVVFQTLFQNNHNAAMYLNIRNRGLRLKSYGGTLGITTVGNNATRTYKYWLDLDENYQATVVGYACHIAHEYCHQKGFFDKDEKPQSAFRDVVPYAIGDIVCDLLNAKLGTNYDCKSQ